MKIAMHLPNLCVYQILLYIFALDIIGEVRLVIYQKLYTKRIFGKYPTPQKSVDYGIVCP